VETAFPISNEISKLPLGEVFRYILSVEWGKAPELKASGDNCNNVHYEKPKTGKDEGENDCNKPRQS
jgi:hypothetical protein